MKKKILIGVLAVFIIMQFFRIDTSNPKVEPGKDFIAIVQPSAEVKVLLKSACYDCHSHTTVYPWYSQIAPVSWWLKDHVDEGKEHLNFSIWGDYSAKKADHKLEECGEEVEEGEMPLSSYTWAHSEAKLTDQQRKTLAQFFNGLRIPAAFDEEDEH